MCLNFTANVSQFSGHPDKLMCVYRIIGQLKYDYTIKLCLNVKMLLLTLELVSLCGSFFFNKIQSSPG